jgi:putative peptide zinc metalloprotease protein
MSDGGDKKGLELLIRKRGADGEADGAFTLKRLQADHVFLRLRPQRAAGLQVEESAIEEAGGTVYVLRNVPRGRYLRLNEREHYIWQRMDGSHTIQDLAVAYFQAFGSFEFSEVRAFLNRARRQGFVEVRPTTLFRARQVARKGGVVGFAGRVATFDRRWEEVDGIFARLHKAVGLLFTRRVLPLHLVVIALGLYTYATERSAGRFGAAEVGGVLYLPLVALGAVASIALHELAHGIATKACGRHVKAVGATMLDYLVPSLYVDVTDMFMGTRWGRIGVSLAGPICSLVLATCAVAGAQLSDSPGASLVFMALADANYAIAVGTLWPWHGLKEDGYNALEDIVRVTALRDRAWQLLRSLVPGSSVPRPAPPLRPLVAYMLAVTTTWALALAVLASLAVRSASPRL